MGDEDCKSVEQYFRLSTARCHRETPRESVHRCVLACISTATGMPCLLFPVSRCPAPQEWTTQDLQHLGRLAAWALRPQHPSTHPAASCPHGPHPPFTKSSFAAKAEHSRSQASLRAWDSKDSKSASRLRGGFGEDEFRAGLQCSATLPFGSSLLQLDLCLAPSPSFGLWAFQRLPKLQVPDVPHDTEVSGWPAWRGELSSPRTLCWVPRAHCQGCRQDIYKIGSKGVAKGARACRSKTGAEATYIRRASAASVSRGLGAY